MDLFLKQNKSVTKIYKFLTSIYGYWVGYDIF